jgi:type VI secretion system activator RovC-like protein
MPTPQPAPAIVDEAPDGPTITAYDRQHLATYLRVLDAHADGASWIEVSRTVLKLDPVRDPEGARRTWASHLMRARWMVAQGHVRVEEDSAPH